METGVRTKELDVINNKWIEYGQSLNGMYWSQIRDCATGLVESGITAETMADIRRFWIQNNVGFADTLPGICNR
jgi:hypothetical protein